MRLDRVFFDTNVVISGIAFDGNERKLWHLALEGRIRPVLCQFVLDEARRTARAKFPKRLQRLEWELSLLDYELVPKPERSLVATAAALVRDADDVEVLAAILAAKPDYAITGDKDLLTDEVKAVAPMCRCAEYLRLAHDS